MNWNDITIGQFQQLNKIRTGEYELEIEREIDVLSCLTGDSVQELEKLPKDELMNVARATDFIKEPLSGKLVHSFRVGMRTFRIVLECQKLNAQQLILILKYAPTLQVLPENIHYLLAVITNEKKWYLRKNLPFEEDFEGKAELFKKAKIETVYATCVFFCKVYNAWLDSTQTSLVTKAKLLLKKAKEEQKNPRK